MRDLVQRKLGLDFVTKLHKIIIANTSTSIQLSVSDMLTRVNFTTFAMADPRCGRLIADSLIQMAPRREHSNSGKNVSIRLDSIRQSDKFAACTLIFK